MLPPAIPANEGHRPGTPRAIDILDSPPQERFDRLTRLAKRMLGVPIGPEPVREARGQAIRINGVAEDMAERKLAREALHYSQALDIDILDSIVAEIAVLDRRGVIIAINRSWRRFAEANGLEPGNAGRGTGVGANYLDACQAATGAASTDDGLSARKGIEAVLAGERNGFTLEYPRPAPARERWFSMGVTPLGRGPRGAVVSHTDITERVQAEASLRENAHQLQALSRRVLEAQEVERRWMAHELHDELGQSLTAIKINLEAQRTLAGTTFTDLNAETIRIAEDALRQVRRLSLALRPTVLDDLGLVPALRWVAEQSAARSGLAMHFHSGIGKARLAPEVETACFRIVQEAFTNIARHARAKRVEVDLYYGGDALVISVQDDGAGFDVGLMRQRALGGGSIGMLGMQERAMLIGGQLDIQSAPGQGCRVRLRCPLRRRGEAL